MFFDCILNFAHYYIVCVVMLQYWRTQILKIVLFLVLFFFCPFELIAISCHDICDLNVIYRFHTWDLLNTRGLDCLGTAGQSTGPMEVYYLEELLEKGLLLTKLIIFPFLFIVEVTFKGYVISV